MIENTNFRPILVVKEWPTFFIIYLYAQIYDKKGALTFELIYTPV